MQYQLVGDSQGDSYPSRFLCGTARLVRLEWSAKGQFEDDCTVCVLTRLESVPFTSVAFTDEGLLHLHTESLQTLVKFSIYHR